MLSFLASLLLALSDGTPAISPKAERIHRSSIVVDGHNDLPEALRNKAESSFDKADISKPQPDYNTDIPRLRKGGVGAQFWAAFTPAETRFTFRMPI